MVIAFHGIGWIRGLLEREYDDDDLSVFWDSFLKLSRYRFKPCIQVGVCRLAITWT